MLAFERPLLELAEFEAIKKIVEKESGIVQVTGCVSSQKVHFMHTISGKFAKKIIVTADEVRAKQIMEEYKFLDSQVYLYLPKDILFYQADLQGKALLSQRMEVMRALCEQEQITIVTTFSGLMDPVLAFKDVRERVITLAVGDMIDFEVLKQELVRFGYSREEQVESQGQFAVRGGIVDIYPLTEEVPIRIELWGDEVDSIRVFDAMSQRSIENLKEFTFYPATDFPNEETVRVSFLDYFDANESLLLLDEPVRLIEQGTEVEEEFERAKQRRMEADCQFSDGEMLLFPVKDIAQKIKNYHSIAFSVLEMKSNQLKPKETFSFQTKEVSSYNKSFEMLTQDLRRLKRGEYRVVLVVGSKTRAKRLAEDLRDYGLSSYYSEDSSREVQPCEIMVMYGHVATGYEYPLLKFVVISETDIFGTVKKKRKRKTYEGQRIQSFSELKVGDYVVHENHGLGIYQGIEKVDVERTTKDYIKITYAGGGNLYIPATQLDLIQKYADSDAKKPKLNRLGGQEWVRTKARVRGAVKEIAKDLVALYAARQSKNGFVYGKDTVWQKEFEEMFPFEETEDQLLAIDATKRDMESTKIMDRLICGDVGYGKTEIAIRAAFKAVQEDKQVVYLAPTTILAQQHYNTFVQRLKEFPVRVDLLCRFRTPAQQKKTIQDLKKGLVDIVIGTHRVLSKDVGYKDLGLLIIDEEQRFGVQHKEQIKKLKENVDVLSLSATPIPRTLHMSLIGIRDMSVLEEAPNDRMPIQTYVMEYNDEMVREAIERELSRGGQVYYVYNKVKDIEEITATIRRLVPQATVAFAHGQMKERELENIMLDFMNGEIDVLVSTTIIETGLDISNANTMIIHNSDQLGLAQMYQLRGRVGRSNRMAYAFLFYRRDKVLKEVAEKRLSAIREFTELGSGIKIAMRDLEIRGAGNLLGAEQHGHMEAVGYDLYCKMLNQAVKQLKDESEEETYTTTVDLNVDAFIPNTYIPNEYQKLDIYKRIASIENEEEMEDMLEELIDRFGDVPKKIQQLLQIALLKARAHEAYVIAIEQKGESLRFVMYERAKVKVEAIADLIEKYKGDLQFKPETNPYFLYHKKGKNKKEKDEDVLELVKNVLIDIKSLIE